MKEFLFRAKSIEGRCWVYGDLMQANREKWKIVHKIDSSCDIDSKTVCQYIFQKDMVDKKIFEGDIVEFYYKPHNQKHRAVVEYDNYLCGWLLNGVKCGVFKFNYDVPINDCLVIGNIHDNPEFLEEEL